MQEEQREGWVPDSKDIHIAGLTNDLISIRDNLKAQLAEKDAKNAEQSAQIVALRGVLQQMLPEWHNEDDGTYANGQIAGEISMGDMRMAKKALSTPAPKVVMLEDHKKAVNALKRLMACADPNIESCTNEDLKTAVANGWAPEIQEQAQAFLDARQVIATFTAKNPL